MSRKQSRYWSYKNGLGQRTPEAELEYAQRNPVKKAILRQGILRGCFLYVMTTVDFRGASFFKIGVSESLEGRYLGIQTGCPLPIELILSVYLPSRSVALAAESALHRALIDFHSSGEWFMFDLADTGAKDEFKAASEKVFSSLVGSAWKWEVTRVVDPDEEATAA